MYSFVDGELEKISGAKRDWGLAWSDIVTVILPDILFGVYTFEYIILIKVLELFLFLFGLQYEAGAHEKKRKQGSH